MLTQVASKLILRGSAMDALYVTRNYFGTDLYALDCLITDFIFSLERTEIQQWADDIANQDCYLSYDYENSTKEAVNFHLAG